ncbi:hypothetical protein EN925_15070 [Mesorhizobium sp. M7A.F.Ca.US.006.04.2.1]|uniref:hypothetical protein n=1 Tax=unclassified Mesorhizobium TaxID=325217 RepID=UPI000FCA9B45|nr:MULTISPECIES: hypothetical protein [unclassified Mesorhizobium]RUX73894.1 hypothetical protein EN990_19660 [Mesorhizobium sp. M7A.F.Ca.US.005.03.1.1]RUY18458.1 hypothetical protein EN991_04080 [Mesorhizobium sp. M7A.F.Ca.US.005.03.2.1]RVA90408.1 hypothetical protein EN925_15070 [Mesorhizobium sp. M7A.F.Ca.US.006.04.2.1]
MSPEVYTGDFFHSPSGTQWVIIFVFETEDIAGLKDGTYVFAVRSIETKYGDDIIYDLFPVDKLGWTTTPVFDEGDVYQLAYEDFAIQGERGPLVQLRREDGSTEFACRWRVAFNMMRGVDVSPEAEWRQATAGQV